MVAVVIGVPAAVVASFVPYRHWDAQAFGLWSKLIATTGDLFPDGLSPAIVHRPLFYVAQGLGWRWLDEGEWVGRWLSLLFAAALVAALWWLAGRLTTDGTARMLLRPLAVSVALASSALALYLVAGLSDLPVAATAALTAVACWSRARPSLRLPLVAAASCATILAKPSGFVAVTGVAAGMAVLLLSERRRLADQPGRRGDRHRARSRLPPRAGAPPRHLAAGRAQLREQRVLSRARSRGPHRCSAAGRVARRRSPARRPGGSALLGRAGRRSASAPGTCDRRPGRRVRVTHRARRGRGRRSLSVRRDRPGSGLPAGSGSPRSSWEPESSSATTRYHGVLTRRCSPGSYPAWSPGSPSAAMRSAS